MTTYIETQDGRRVEVRAYVEGQEDEIMELKKLLNRAHRLVHEAAGWVEFDTTAWHPRAESFLGDCLGHL